MKKKLNVPKPKKGYRIIYKGKVKPGDFVKELGPWEKAQGLIGAEVIKCRTDYNNPWFVCRKIK